MKKEEIIKRIEIELKESIHHPYELNLVDLIADFFNKRKKRPQEEIDEELKFLLENITNAQAWSSFEYKYNKLISKRDNPNWKNELKEEYKINFKKFIILCLIPTLSLIYGIGFLIDEISNKQFNFDLLIYYIQLLMIHLIIPIYIYNPFNQKIWEDEQKNYNIVYNVILERFVFGGNLLFFTSLITMIIKFYGYNLTNNLIWGDIRFFVIPFCIGFVFFYNSFLKIRNNKKVNRELLKEEIKKELIEEFDKK
jgi:hypothetical protein